MRNSVWLGSTVGGLLLGVISIIDPCTAHAAAFYLQDHSASALGAAYAGGASTANDASILYYNPAGMTMLKGGTVTLTGTGLTAQESLKNRGTTPSLGGTPVGPSDGSNSIITSVIPSGFVAYPVYEDRVWLGLALTTPFGLSNDYKDDWFGRFDSVKSDLRTYDINPSIAVKINKYLSIGGGPNFQHGTAELTSAVTPGGGFVGTEKLNGDDNAWGYSLGATITPLDGTRIGLDYRSQINYKLNGRETITGLTGIGIGLDAAAHAKLDLPDQATVGISQDIGKQWTVMSQLQWFGWSNFHDITATSDAGVVAPSTTREAYKNTLNFALGAQYKYNPQWTFRGGYQFDDSPTSSPSRDTRIPDANRNWFTAGTTYSYDQHLSFDLGLAYIRLNDSSVTVTRTVGAFGAGSTSTISADKKGGQIGLLALGANYKF